jgi:hypothetical protein
MVMAQAQQASTAPRPLMTRISPSSTRKQDCYLWPYVHLLPSTYPPSFSFRLPNLPSPLPPSLSTPPPQTNKHRTLAPTATAPNSSSPPSQPPFWTTNTSSSERSLRAWTSCAKWRTPRRGIGDGTCRIWMLSLLCVVRCELGCARRRAAGNWGGVERELLQEEGRGRREAQEELREGKRGDLL